MRPLALESTADGDGLRAWRSKAANVLITASALLHFPMVLAGLFGVGPPLGRPGQVVIIAGFGVSVAGSTAYVSHFPCVHCAKILAAAGIRAVKYHVDYKNDPLVFDLLDEAGLVISRL